MTTNWVVVLDDGETYGSIEGAVTLILPDHIDEAHFDQAVRELAPLEGEPVVPLSDLLDSVRLALESGDWMVDADEVIATVEDYVTNHYGD